MLSTWKITAADQSPIGMRSFVQFHHPMLVGVLCSAVKDPYPYPSEVEGPNVAVAALEVVRRMIVEVDSEIVVAVEAGN